jgi:hypothetical protein
MERTGGAVTTAEVVGLLERVRSGGSMSEVLRELTRMCARPGPDTRAWLELRDPSGPLVMTSWPVAPLASPEVLFDALGPGTRVLGPADPLLAVLEARAGARCVFHTAGIEGVLAAVSSGEGSGEALVPPPRAARQCGGGHRARLGNRPTPARAL